MNHQDLIAIDIHTHAEVSCWNPFDSYGEEYDRAADKYFGSNRRPTIEETVAYYRERKIGLVMFTVDSEAQLGRRRIPNEEIAEAAKKNSDMMIAFASIDPHKGKMGAREAERLIQEEGIKGFKFHPTVQGYHPYDKMAWPIYEVINHHKMPAIFHTGHSGTRVAGFALARGVDSTGHRCYVVLPIMRAQGGGAIVNQSSTAAYLYAGFYGLAKAGVNSITQQLAHEVAGSGIRVNAIAPGPIDTEASRSVVPDAFMQPILDGLAIKRQGQPADLVGMCLFLLSDETSWMTGHVVNVDGGQIFRA
mgnify:CR=1 FL=1